MKRSNQKERKPDRAFTLIELTVVVVIIGVLASLAMPAAMRARDRSSLKAAHIEQMKEAAGNHRIPFEKGDRGIIPIVEAFSANLSLNSDYQRVGLEVYSRYQLSGAGTISFRGSRESEQDVRVEIPFPEGTVEASNVYFRFISDTGSSMEPEDVTYHQKGIFWTGKVPAGETLHAEFGFTSLGTEVAAIVFPPARRLSNVALTLDLSKSEAREITSYSLIPTEYDEGVYTWNFDNLVSDRNITVKIPGAESPGGRLLTLFRFVAVAVFLFGAGFLYMNESKAPGRLDKFRLGHFSLLALTYSLFFIIFGVIIYREHLTVVPALLIAGVCSIPLLMIHVAKITDASFAVRHILPLAIVTLALVVTGVYGGSFRDYGFLLLLIAVTAYLTITFKPRRRDDGDLEMDNDLTPSMS